MKRLISYFPVLLGTLFVLVAIFITGGFTIAGSAAPPSREPLAQETASASTSPPGPSEPQPVSSQSWLSIQAKTTESKPSNESSLTQTSNSRTSTSQTSQTTTQKPQVPVTGPKGKYSSIRVFLDLQRIIFYKIDPDTGQEYEAYAVKCSTGLPQYPTPTTGPDKPFILNGRKAKLTIFNSTKSTVKCWVRYATQIRGSYWFHSVPYDYLEDRDGKPKFDPARCYMYSGYDILGSRTSSHGCIRLALRDANFLFNNTYSGMPCYIIKSYQATYPGKKALAPAPLPPALKGPRNWDPTDPDWKGYKTPSLPDPAPPPTTGVSNLTEETTLETTTWTTVTATETAKPTASPTQTDASTAATTVTPSDPPSTTEGPAGEDQDLAGSSGQTSELEDARADEGTPGG